MANGKPSDPEKFVIRYGVRSGLKREFAFALKSQADLPNSLGRTRSGRAAANPAAAASPDGKRPRNYDAGDEQKKFSKPLPDAVVILALSAGTAMERDTAAMDFSAVGATKEGYPKNSVDAPILEFGKEGLEKDDESSDAPGSNEGLEKEMPLVEKPIVIYRRSASKIKPENSLTSTPQAPPPPSSTEPEAVKLESPHDTVKYKVSNSQLKIGSVLENPMVSKGYNVTRIGNGVAEKPIRRFTRSALKLMPVAATPDTIKQEEKLSEGEPVSVAPVAVEQDKKLSEVEPVSVAPLEVEQEGKLSEVEPVSVAPLAVEQEESLVEIPIIVDEIGGLEFQSGQVEASIKDELEGSVSVTLITEDEKDEMDEINDGAQFEKLSRRFTRPSLKVAAEDSTGADASTTTSIDSVESEELKGDSDALDVSLSLTSKNKMELKMSKKITLTKLPSNVRDLLGTGLLEGLPVKYISCIGKSVGLQGVIRGNGVLCSCISCKGTNVVSAYQFEIHAGSTKKHPSDFIFLQNGKSLRDVLKSCTGAPLDMLEAAIQNAIGLAPPKKFFVCQKCKEIFDTARIGYFALLCDTCLETSHRQSTPPSSYRTVISAKLPRKVLMPSPSDGVPKNPVSQKKPSYGKLTRKDLGLHKLVFMDDILPQGTEVGYYIRGKRLLEGYIKDSGIFCRCCNCVVSPSQFEAHAGQASRRKPYNNIYTSNGVSLHELSVSLSKGRKLSPTENDDLCGICADGGDLLLCDLCPRAFHKECVGLSSIPTGDWFCQYCQNLRLKEKYLAHNDNAIAAGRVAGVDPIEQIIKRCIRIVTAPDNDATVCALCREHDFSRFGFDRRTVIICDQCETEYHVGCLKDHDMADLKDLPEGEWFCRPDCSRIRSSLRDLLCQGPNVLDELDADIIKKKLNNDAAIDIRWRLLSGKDDSADSKLLLSQAVSIFRESFDPIVEPISGRDLIPYMVYGRNMRDQDFGGMYCMVLTLNSSVVSAGLLRVLGCEVGELPLVATERESQGRGYFQALFSCIERLFESLNVKHFVLPAADEAESIWTKKLGFAKLTPAQLREYAKGARPMIFHGTSMLHKPVLYHQEPVLVSDENTIMPPA